MTIYEETLEVYPASERDFLNKVLNTNPSTEDECLMGEDDTISYTVTFTNGIEADIKICGVGFEEGEDNSPWTEMVLFDDGCEIGCSEPSDEFFGDWELECDDVIYIVHII